MVADFAATTPLQTKTGTWTVRVYETKDGVVHTAGIKGNLSDVPCPLVRVHSSCFTSEILGSSHCDCSGQLEQAMERIEAAGAGVLIYLHQEGRGIGLVEKIKAYELQQRDGLDTVEANIALGHQADQRDYHAAATMLQDIGVRQIRLLTNNPTKKEALESYGIVVQQICPIETTPQVANSTYLKTKKEKMGHLLSSL